MTRRVFSTALTLSLALAAACNTADDEVYYGGADLQKVLLSRKMTNDRELNGLRYNGLRYNGLRYNGLRYNGVELQGVTITGSALGGEDSVSSLWVTGRDLAGTEMVAELEAGGQVDLRIDNVYWNNTIQAYLYIISSFDGAAWQPVCGVDTEGKAIPALPLSDVYDPSTGAPVPSDEMFSLTCTNAALGKCVLWGYQVWGERSECNKSGECKTQKLRDWHQACTHMVRADYCGDGVPHTRNGTEIDIYDSIGIQSREGSVGSLESEWRTDGAWCIQKTRWYKADGSAPWTSDLDYVRTYCPERLAENNPGECGDLSKSTWNTEYGFSVDTSARSLVRNDSGSNSGSPE